MGSIPDAFASFGPMDAKDGICGMVIHERYEVMEKVGSGGMADIYAANDRKTRTRVAIKLMGETIRKKDMTDRFFREANAAALIDHPNVIRIVDIGTFSDRIFCVMEFIEGASLSEVVRRGPLPLERALDIAMQVSDALEAAHARNIIHRDMKPENIMLIDRSGRDFAKVLDFGLAKITDNDDSLTKENIILGTPSYMAPEQAWGGGVYDHRVDIYSLGIIMYEMLTGSVPFRSDETDDKARTLQILLSHKQKMPIRPSIHNPSIPPGIEDVVMKALEKDPRRRFCSALEMKGALLRCMAAQEVTQPAIHDAAEAEVLSPATRRIEQIMGGPLDEARPRWSIWRLAKRLLAAGAIAFCIGYPVYHYSDDIGRFAAKLRDEARPAQGPSPGASGIPVRRESEVTLESEPPGASIYEISASGKAHLGTAPLTFRLEKGEMTILVSKKGYQGNTIAIRSSMEPQFLRVKLQRERRRRAPGAENASPAPEASDAGPAAESEVPALPEPEDSLPLPPGPSK